MLSEGGMHAVKLQGGAAVSPIIKRIVSAGIPVMGHVGRTPQSVHAVDGFGEGKNAKAAQRVRDDARTVAEAGAYAIVLQGIPRRLAASITTLN